MRSMWGPLLAAVLPLALIQIVAWGTIYFSFPLFLAAMEEDLGWSRSQLTAGMTLALAVAALVQLAIGRLIGRWGAAPLMGAGCLLGMGAMLWLSLVESLAAYYLGWSALGVTMALAFFEPAFAALLERVPDRFSHAVALLVMLSGLAGATFLPLAHWLIGEYGWRSALLAFAFSLGGAGALAWILGERWGKTRRSSRQDRAVSDRYGGQAHAKPREFRFWALALGFAMNTFVVTALAVHLFGFLLERGFSERMALLAIAVIGPAQIAGRLVQMLLMHRLAEERMASLAFAAMLAGLLGLQLCGTQSVSLWSAVICVGVSSGMITTLRGTLIALLFRREHYAHAAGMLAAPGSLLRAAAPLGASVLSSGMTGYQALGWMMIGLAALAFIFMAYALWAYR